MHAYYHENDRNYNYISETLISSLAEGKALFYFNFNFNFKQTKRKDPKMLW